MVFKSAAHYIAPFDNVHVLIYMYISSLSLLKLPFTNLVTTINLISAVGYVVNLYIILHNICYIIVLHNHFAILPKFTVKFTNCNLEFHHTFFRSKVVLLGTGNTYRHTQTTQTYRQT